MTLKAGALRKPQQKLGFMLRDDHMNRALLINSFPFDTFHLPFSISTAA